MCNQSCESANVANIHMQLVTGLNNLQMAIQLFLQSISITCLL